MKENELRSWANLVDPNEILEMSTLENLAGWKKRVLYKLGKELARRSPLQVSELEKLFKIYNEVKGLGSKSEFSTVEEFVDSTKENTRKVNSKHLCVRLAWHDNKWDGSICSNPQDNIYCVGENSLLSERIRRRRDLDVECSASCRGKLATKENVGNYTPPCFWSINAFGNTSLDFVHDNPVVPEFPLLPQKLPPYSIVSWPFKLSFVRSPEERKKYKGSYYPKEIFESRISKFQSALEPKASVIFSYCKFSNPVSGEDMDYLLVGCALLKEMEAPQRFNVSDAQLKKTQEKLRQPNFPTLNWALRYTQDFANSGVRLPYHEYLKMMERDAGISNSYIDDIKVSIREPELLEGFLYVAKHVDDDQAIYLLTKIRRSLLKVKEHALLNDEAYDVEANLKNVEFLLKHCWEKRGYLPGFPKVAAALMGDAEADRINDFFGSFELKNEKSLKEFVRCFETGESQNFQDIVGGILDEIEDYDLSVGDFIRLASLNLTTNQFLRIIKKEGLSSSLSEVATNPYLIYEEYTPDKIQEDLYSGEKIDGQIDLFKIDIALFPERRFLARATIHDWKVSDPRRIRSVLLSSLRELDRKGHCYEDAESLRAMISEYPLFYKFDQEYIVKVDLNNPGREYADHFREKVVHSKISGTSVYYLKDLYDDERFVSDSIKYLVSASSMTADCSSLEQEISPASALLSKKIGERFDPVLFKEERLKLYKQALEKRLMILTGAPGAGKSFELLNIVKKLKSLGEQHIILSLTGKAVLRLKNNEQKLNVEAFTIDKFLADIERMGSAKKIVQNLVIDEASMIDLPKLAKVLRAIDIKGKDFKRLILVGDENQLPPIGFGKPFADIIEFITSSPEMRSQHFISLDTNCRAELPQEFVDFTKVFSNQTKFYEKNFKELKDSQEICAGVSVYRWKNKSDLQVKLLEAIANLPDIKGKNADQVLDAVLGLNASTSGAAPALDKFQLLSPYNSGFYGASGLNQFFQLTLRRSENYYDSSSEQAFKLRDKVIHTQNEYKDNKLFVSNGSMGLIIGEKKVFFEEHERAYAFHELKYAESIELAYAITVHKAQGSGFGTVFLVIPSNRSLISRELVYTALTRAKKKVVLFIESENGEEIPKMFEKIRARSSIDGRKTSLFFNDSLPFAYVPVAGVVVKSRIEYIILKKLIEAREKFGGFDVNYELEYPLQGKGFSIHPDFTIKFLDGRTIYWEHLGRVDSKSYMASWDNRKKIYQETGNFEKVLTTDELNGIDDLKIESIISQIIKNDIKPDMKDDRYSKMHFTLR